MVFWFMTVMRKIRQLKDLSFINEMDGITYSHRQVAYLRDGSWYCVQKISMDPTKEKLLWTRAKPKLMDLTRARGYKRKLVRTGSFISRIRKLMEGSFTCNP